MTFVATFKPYLIKKLYIENLNEPKETKYNYFDLYDYCVYIEDNKNKFKFNGKIQEILEPIELIKNPLLEIDGTNLIMEIQFNIPKNGEEKIKEFGKNKNNIVEQLKCYFSEIYGNYYEGDELVNIPVNSEWLNNTGLFDVKWFDDLKINIGIGLCFIDCKMKND